MHFSHPTTEHDLIDLLWWTVSNLGQKGVQQRTENSHVIFGFSHFEAQNTFPGLFTVFKLTHCNWQ